MEKVAIKVVAAAALLALVSAPAVRAADATVGVDVNSAYVFRGITFNEGFVAQPYLEVSGLPIDIGVWGNFDIESDEARGYGDSQFSEVDIYGSYALPIEEVDVSVGYTEYTYPTGGIDADREISLSFGLDTILAPSLGIFYGLDGGIEENFYAEAGVGHDVALTEEVGLSLGALIGYLDPKEGDSGFHQYALSASLSYEFVSLGVTYYGQVDDDVLTDDAYDVEVVGTLGVSHSF
jgi:hypothetical protein